MSLEALKFRIQDIAGNLGAADLGVCRLDELRENFHFEIKEISEKLNTGISIGVPLMVATMNTIIDRPNRLYQAHYQQVNHTLNDIAYAVSSEIQKSGGMALPIPASQLLSWKPMRAHLSHREIAYKAGLGWRGRNNLLVNPKHGSQYRLVTILTDVELEPDDICGDDCDFCFGCAESCPAGAIGDEPEDFNLAACAEQVAKFARLKDNSHHICGLCLKACPGSAGGKS